MSSEAFNPNPTVIKPPRQLTRRSFTGKGSLWVAEEVDDSTLDPSGDIELIDGDEVYGE